MMRTIDGLRHGALALLLGLSCALAGIAQAHAATTLTAFTSEADLQRFLKKLPRRSPPPPPSPPPPMAGALGAAETTAVDAVSAKAPSITNNQEANVDEGDIIKLHGETLVILRRGRLFTVSTAGGGLRPVDSINAYPPGVDASGDWYDEMLMAGNRIVVIGYSYSRGGTQIDRFQIDGKGHLKFEDAYQLRSNDYYSARNYASRLIGNQLILYSPRYLPYGGADPLEALPALRRWTAQGVRGRFERIGTAREVYLSPAQPLDQIDAVHTVTSCDLMSAVLACKATSVFGPDGRTFYVSAHAVYVWVSPWWGAAGPGKRAPSLLYRLPLDGSAPSAIGVRGQPVDQFSFREDASDGMLNVLVRAETTGDAMWDAEHARGAVALLRFALGGFGDGMRQVEPARYRGLPTPKTDSEFHNRFVGDYVLYGEGNGWLTPQNASSVAIVAPVRGGAVVSLALPHGVDRIEAMGHDAVIVGSDANNVYFSAVELGGDAPRLGDRYVMTGAAQAETRSHGFFFSPDPSSSNDSGVLGLPVARPAKPAYRQLFDTSAAMLFVRRSGGKFAPLGELDAGMTGVAPDACVASCVDWYGNARPIFLRGRTFALLGYELVEGAVGETAISETRRVSFAPGQPMR